MKKAIKENDHSTCKTPRQWMGAHLAQVDGHTILHPMFFQGLENEALGVRYDPWHMVLHLGDEKWVSLFHLFKSADHWMEELPKDGGFWAAGEAEIGIWVLDISNALVSAYGLDVRGCHGRGSQHRTNCDALVKAEDE